MNNSEAKQVGEILGFAIASTAYGIPYETILEKKANWESGIKDEGTQKLLAKIASTIVSPEINNVEHTLYNVIGKTEGPLMGYTADQLLGNAARVLGMQKNAGFLSGVANTIAELAGKAAVTLPEMYKTLLLAGAGLGVAGGSAYWALNRAAENDDAEVEAKEEQAKHYRRVAHDLKRRMKLEHDVKHGTTTALEDETDAYVI